MARVLVVDDAVFIRHMIRDLLTRHGHDVVGEAADGIEAVQQFRSLRPDVTTLDIAMPRQDGIAALREIMTVDPSARVIMCSALKERPNVLAALQAGARDYVIKPVHPDRVLQAVDTVLQPVR